jgi:pSer/pThr/pTyr-binding forkhead associated (FHA) protein
MPSQYLDEFIRELRRDGDTAFRAHHAAPVLIVTRAEGDGKSSAGETGETTVMAETSGWRIQQVSLLNRVFALTRGAFEKETPLIVGRSDKVADIVMPDDSVSKRHCLFERTPEGVTITDCGSTNGTTVGEVDLPPNKPYLLRGGETIGMGNFSLLFQTPDGFVAYLNHIVKL